MSELSVRGQQPRDTVSKGHGMPCRGCTACLQPSVPSLSCHHQPQRPAPVLRTRLPLPEGSPITQNRHPGDNCAPWVLQDPVWQYLTAVTTNDLTFCLDTTARRASTVALRHGSLHSQHSTPQCPVQLPTNCLGSEQVTLKHSGPGMHVGEPDDVPGPGFGLDPLRSELAGGKCHCPCLGGRSPRPRRQHTSHAPSQVLATAT